MTLLALVGIGVIIILLILLWLAWASWQMGSTEREWRTERRYREEHARVRRVRGDDVP